MNAAALPDFSIAAFEAGTIDPDTFDHEAHVFLAWLYLDRYELTESIRRFTTSLRQLTKKLGMPGKYHQTITWFFILLTAERRETTRGKGWFEFRRENDDLFSCRAILDRYYSRALLASEQARSTFLLPDKLAGHSMATIRG